MFNTGGYSLADISAATGGNRNNGNGDGLFGGSGAWIIIILFLFVFLGWGNKWGNNGNGDSGNGMASYLPLLLSSSSSNAVQPDLQRSFDNQQVVSKLDGLNSAFCNLGYTQLGEFNGINQNIMQTGFAIQQAINNGTVANMQNANALQAQISNCCCETREAIQGVNYNMATNTCNVLNAMNGNTRDIIESQNAGTRAILDYLCQDKISTLQNENQALRLAASQQQQNVALGAMMEANTAEILRRTAPTPVPAYAVPAPYPYGYNGGCGCNSGCGCV